MHDTAALDRVVAHLAAEHPSLPPGRILRCVLRCRRELRGASTGIGLWPAVQDLASRRLAELHQNAG